MNYKNYIYKNINHILKKLKIKNKNYFQKIDIENKKKNIFTNETPSKVSMFLL